MLIVASGELGKPRPAVVVQADELGDTTTAIIVCPMSSDVSQDDRLRPIVEPTATNGIQAPSQVMTDKIVALRRSRFRRVLGRLDDEACEAIDQALLLVLGLAR